jgi:hypothetical protein
VGASLSRPAYNTYLQPNAERTQRLFASLREELERKGPRVNKTATDGVVGG